MRSIERKKYAVPEHYVTSLKRFFGFTQDYLNEDEIYYYEREWRILGNNLTLVEDSPVSPGHAGVIKKTDRKDILFLQLDDNDIEFLICPKKYAKELMDMFDYPVTIYDYLIV
ncbi:hypothetical protein BMS3Abin07_02247 [bacterium BMS3Abin07]|nr:hypothetical protein BMS3Abin07_02247 [bacterium BMS3Abin07]